MRRFRSFAFVTAILALAAPAHSQTSAAGALRVLGTVKTAAQPLSNALVIALNLEDLAATQTFTALDGSFALPALRHGIYKIIAVKQGFLPAITTLVPTRPQEKIALHLEPEKGRKRTASQEIWELRGSLPPDILRELDHMIEPLGSIVTYELPRFSGEMQSLTGVSRAAESPNFAQTSLGVQSRLTDNWQLDFSGNLHRVHQDPTDEEFFGKSIAESSTMEMELRSSSADSYKLASTKSRWLYAQPGADSIADVRAHNFEWKHGMSRVQVRYFAQDNLFHSSALSGSNLLEIAGNATVLQTRRSDLGLSVRVTQESADSNPDALRTADLAANGTFMLVPSLIVHYGMSSRLGVEGQELSPRTGAEWKIGRTTALVASGQYKVLDRGPASVVMPSIVFWSDEGRVMPKYAYSFGIVSGKDDNNRASAIMTVSAIDSPLRVVFTDGYDHFWDGLRVDSGDVRRDLRLAYRREIGNVMAFDFATTAGTATSRDVSFASREKVYVTGDLQSTFMPTRTTLAVSYREIQQPHDGTIATGDYRAERINVRMAQSLYLPIDVKLLLGVELARAENSPYLVDALTVDGSRKYIGGLALNF
jgi:hypothetical protein